MRSDARAGTSVADGLRAFVIDRYPFAATAVVEAFRRAAGGRPLSTPGDIDAVRPVFRQTLRDALRDNPDSGAIDIAPRVSAGERWRHAIDALVEECDAALRRQALRHSL